MALTATYFYCNTGGGTSSVVVTLLVGSESTYFTGTVGDCYITKKRRKITASIPSAISQPLLVRYDSLYKIVEEYGEYEDEYREIGSITIAAGNTSNYKYVDTYIRSECTDGTDPYDRGVV